MLKDLAKARSAQTPWDIPTLNILNMTIFEYLKKKYRTNKPSMMSKKEAEAFGLAWPLKKGWLEKHGQAEVTDYMRERLAARAVEQQPKAKRIEVKSRRIAKPVKLSTYRGPKIDPNSPEFLASYQWRSLRMDALVKYGAVCMCCGDSPANGAIIHVDHIKPRKLRPDLALDINNLQILCGVCNHGKGNRHDTDWRPVQREEGAESFDEEFSLSRVSEMLSQF